MFIGVSSPEGHHFGNKTGPTQWCTGFSAGTPQAKQPTGWLKVPKVILSLLPPLNAPLYVALSTRGTRTSSTHQRTSQSLPPTRKPAILTRGQTPQNKKELQSCNLRNRDNKHRKVDNKKWQRNMFQMKEQNKTLEEQPSEVEICKLPEKEFSDDSKDHPRSWKKNGDTD